MSSILLGQPFASGATVVISGNPWSGTLLPVGGVRLKWVSSGGNAYVGLSGGGPPLSGGFLTVTSGGFPLSGGGILDGFLLAPGDNYFIPFCRFKQSGTYSVYAQCDAAASGIGRMFYDADTHSV